MTVAPAAPKCFAMEAPIPFDAPVTRAILFASVFALFMTDLLLRSFLDEMNVETIDLGYEIRQGVHFCFDLAPVILCRPIARERLDRRELYSLGCICNRFALRPLCRVDAPAQFDQFRFRNIYMKRTNRILATCWLAACSTGLGHGV